MSDGPYIDWEKFWAGDTDDSDWLFEDILAKGRGHAIYASHKTGKSLLMLWIAAKLATSPEPVVVLYLDYEMTESDLRERLEDMGYGPGHDLSKFKYALLPSLGPLDTSEGGGELLLMVDELELEYQDHHIVVVIDTISRAVKGEENSADTIRAFYRATGLPLKQRGVTWARLDHAGKDAAKGQRGSSGKGDDIDVIWRLEKTDTGLTLHKDVARMRWVPEKVAFRLDDPTNFTRVDMDIPAGTKECAALLDHFGVDLDMSMRAAAKVLKDRGQKIRFATVQAAVRYRKEADAGVAEVKQLNGTHHGTHPVELNGTRGGTHPPEIAPDQHGTHSGHTGTHPASSPTNESVSRRDTPRVSAEPDSDTCRRLGCIEPVVGTSKHGVDLCSAHLNAGFLDEL